MLPNETPTTPEPTPGATVNAFRRQYGLTVGRLAVLLDLDPEVLCQYEADAGPPWLIYALLGVEYQQFGVVTGFAADERPGSGLGDARGEVRSEARSQDAAGDCAPSPSRGVVGLTRDGGSVAAESRPAAA